MAKYPYMNRVVAHSTSANLDSSWVFAAVQEAKCESVFFHIRLPRAALNRFDLCTVQVTYASLPLSGWSGAAANGKAAVRHALARVCEQGVPGGQLCDMMYAAVSAGFG